jgi:hypothetical protein
MSETLKATIVGTIIIGIFMLISAKMVTSSVWDLAHHTRSYLEAQKVELKQIVKFEQRKAKDVFLEGTSEKMACMKQCPVSAKAKK